MKFQTFALSWLVALSAFGQVRVPHPATQAEVNAGTDQSGYVTPKTFAGATVISPGASVVVRFNNSASLWSAGGDTYFQVDNYATNNSGGGFGMGRIGMVAGVPTVVDPVAVGMLLVTTNNSSPGLLPGWVDMVVNNGVLGWAFCKPGFTLGSMPDPGNYSLLVLDWTNGLVRIPYIQSGAYDPRTNKWRDIFTANPLNGNISIGNSNGTVNITNLVLSATAMTMAAGTGSPVNCFAIGNDSFLVDRSGNVTAGSQGLGNSGIFRAARHIATGFGSDQYLTSLGHGMGADASGDINFNSADGQSWYIGAGAEASSDSQGVRVVSGTDAFKFKTPVIIQTIKESSGTGSPNSVVTGSPGDIFHRTDGGAATSLYVKESGSATTTGWVGK